MSRKLTLALAALATLASASLVTGAADARVAHNNVRWVNHFPHHHAHLYVRHYYGPSYVRSVGYVRPVVSNGPCTCLTKDYTPEGQVVFKDLCTKETAMAPVDGAPEKASAVDAPTNMAGKTYQDYLAANQAAQKN